jgi:hypothetical protein
MVALLCGSCPTSSLSLTRQLVTARLPRVRPIALNTIPDYFPGKHKGRIGFAAGRAHSPAHSATPDLWLPQSVGAAAL